MTAVRSCRPHQHFWLFFDALWQDCPIGEAVYERVADVLESDFAGENRRYRQTPPEPFPLAGTALMVGNST
jgi:hypothetical protein